MSLSNRLMEVKEMLVHKEGVGIPTRSFDMGDYLGMRNKKDACNVAQCLV